MLYSKLFKNIIAVVMVVVATLFVGCSKDDNAGGGGEYADSPIVGTWSYTESGFDAGEPCSYQKTVTFKANGKFTVKTKISYDDGESYSESVSGTFEFNDPYLYLYVEGEEAECRVSFSADYNKLFVTENGLSVEYTRQ